MENKEIQNFIDSVFNTICKNIDYEKFEDECLTQFFMTGNDDFTDIINRYIKK